ncbi:helix-turn-helix domain-containing protein [Plectonema cf. radiosum LEGE 06105]|uniref:Helix-turn-helix domain-containing protein n=1 Tax=Plectonema cf. radiosum LEGE 06105 TaxID=945769 RepID=A0A8J7K0X1_9CYAN|nr:helix-turn-helix domain-containing protein [Plectonema radiosum]MBE9212977.1 helix-turn-helix domain-containing protein [Plectonema cf. radiosum LEGE 06105]
MYVSTSQAAEILNISSSRMRYLVTEGRVKGAYKAGRNWIIPLFEGNPIISRGSRGPKAKWCRRNPPTTRIHVNRHRIQQNLKQQNLVPVITVKHRGQNIYGFSVKINGPCEVVYRPEKPLSCGAVLWVETHSSVEVECSKSNQEDSFIVSTG